MNNKIKYYKLNIDFLNYIFIQKRAFVYVCI